MNPTPQIALLAASGVSEHEMTAIQRALAAAKLRAHVVSPENGLIHSWGDGTWGHCYPADAKLETSLGSDYDMLILPGGERHVQKLLKNPHTRRFVSAFFTTGKPLAVFAEGAEILKTNELSGDNALILSYEDADALMAAADQMIAHIAANAPAAMAQAA
ncbi:MAG: DJ-1/PfpI family protein [Rhodospirillales bacterium]|nr:DJ-1/PfpI family protein [Alphaproteobacteria bacterium]MCB9986130.1 DJ-1/PfpI family protein [Rhodospirillales bacterium]USO07311.1 MAG: DJ-1/PfpI family protein [Rhodospirillales bacterium]